MVQRSMRLVCWAVECKIQAAMHCSTWPRELVEWHFSPTRWIRWITSRERLRTTSEASTCSPTCLKIRTPNRDTNRCELRRMPRATASLSCAQGADISRRNLHTKIRPENLGYRNFRSITQLRRHLDLDDIVLDGVNDQ